jgi:hypothetical protein
MKQNFLIKKRRVKKYKYKFFSENNKMTFLHSDFINLESKPLSPAQKIKTDYLPSSIVSDLKVLKIFLTTKVVSKDFFVNAGYLNKDLPKPLPQKPTIDAKLKFQKEKKTIEEYIRYYTFMYRRLYLIKSNVTVKNNKSMNLLHRSVILNYIRKERLYTKLKYSRSPAYDIVSGGAAALLAGFLGFLISEKYGFELADSGDFYYLFMYAVFFCFSFRPLLASIGSSDSIKDIFSLKFFLDYYFFLIYFFLRKN